MAKIRIRLKNRFGEAEAEFELFPKIDIEKIPDLIRCMGDGLYKARHIKSFEQKRKCKNG